MPKKLPKKIKKSKFNMTGQDPLTEQMYGEGAVRLADCRMVMRDGGTEYIQGNNGSETSIKKWVSSVWLSMSPTWLMEMESFKCGTAISLSSPEKNIVRD